MSNSNRIKSEQLKMSHGKAGNILRKKIIFYLAQKTGIDSCFKCGEKILTVDEISIEHKVPWMYSEDPVKLFFDMENIAFSHAHICNKAHRYPKAMDIPEGMSWCSCCKEFKPILDFTKNKFKRDGLDSQCRQCRADIYKNK